MASAEWKETKKERSKTLIELCVVASGCLCMSAVFNLLLPYPTVQVSY